MQQITILGSTGSVGVSTLDVIARHPDRYSVYALTAQSKVEELAQQCARFKPQVAVVGSAEAAKKLQVLLDAQGLHTQVGYGEAALCAVASAPECDSVMAAIVGAAGLAPTLAAARSGKRVLLANKEALVMSGPLLMEAVAASGAILMPIDSEHNAIFQCMPATCQRTPLAHGVEKILLTASGGPFLKRDVNTLDQVSWQEAVAHPKWVMGRKISVDSATMMNKGLEVIEAHWLFDLPAERIEVVIHPQSVVHSMVSYVDGSVLAQLGNPDMRTPIAHALAYPERISSGVPPIDLIQIAQLSFERPDFLRFPCLKLAYDALQAGGSAPAIMNAANEIAVQAFLDSRIGFRAIDQLIARVMDVMPSVAITDIESVFAQDRCARELANSFIPS
ncbi:1-deoxy-D-xylulose-5-phosphate reductoisomerase [Janthinobacterium sp. Marseille]|uniref:1-deoxy-D-xylulose 5-phosphate reductoisomerase n=1 Tax=Janthinobacterium sp. (strain Marseille) TaxID=375286 RepID=DXR_JANMA|nr:1-deoxy-D-xylulose-5-phosphate reductoisomerase [Janthinobacterium sp. Marseille]A6SZP5.1 RecName: Full=1-deoxy-D-xylulose 5-phosphate reductoisomerase; Short=DXP reductoisomerase; AltName: Full=1-deoxyxylulose-5-phosphate reductoisomerase; AltName: Full=2-C-methyl-D-erythritol 4-phosphate synthase [Janthinobacterium sp. Marseille]ABR88508.1 1-deoxy-D-xylulose-5-phosphate reductoisomerase [Janthinobacterium sp. Marseille]